MSDVDSEPLLHIVLYEPEIAPNVGAVGRTCVGVGAKLWLVEPLGFRITDAKLRRAGLDYWQYLDLEIVESFARLRERLPQVATDAWLFTAHTERIYTDQRFRRGSVLIFGCESHGLPASLLVEFPGRSLRIPVSAEARCLNLSVSVGVASYEVMRQLR